MIKKKKNNKLFLTIILCFFLNGCFALTPHSMNKLSVGISKKEVYKKMGKPFSTAYGNDKQFLIYYLYHDIYDLFINPKKFPFFGFYPILRTGHEYYVVLNESEKVISYGKSSGYKGSLMDMSNKKLSGIIIGE